MPMNARIDAPDLHDLLEHQPMDYRIEPLEAVVDTAADGTPIVSKRNGVVGMPIEWEWGRVVDPATVDELNTKHNGQVTHQIYFTDKGGNDRAYNVMWIAPPRIDAGPGAPYRPLTIKFIVISEVTAS